MIKVFELDEAKMEEIYREEVRAHLQRIEDEKVYWTMKDLQKHTGYSIPHIREHILFDPLFPAFRDGKLWRILAKEARVYLEQRGLIKYREQRGQSPNRLGKAI
ncbi:group-specific protein [Solibacillus silvestris]